MQHYFAAIEGRKEVSGRQASAQSSNCAEQDDFCVVLQLMMALGARHTGSTANVPFTSARSAHQHRPAPRLRSPMPQALFGLLSAKPEQRTASKQQVSSP